MKLIPNEGFKIESTYVNAMIIADNDNIETKITFMTTKQRKECLK